MEVGEKMKRAMTEDAKTAKAKLILNKAYELYLESNFTELKMIDIARSAGVSKGTLFNYFKTKEILFMEMLFREYDKRIFQLEERILSYHEMTYNEFKVFFLKEMEELLEPSSAYIRLNAIKNSILEKNIDYETAMKDKVNLHHQMMRISKLLSERVAILTPEDVLDLYVVQNVIIIGYYNMTQMPDDLKKMIDDHGLEGFAIDYSRSSLRTMETYLEGLYNRKKNT